MGEMEGSSWSRKSHQRDHSRVVEGRNAKRRVIHHATPRSAWSCSRPQPLWFLEFKRAATTTMISIGRPVVCLAPRFNCTIVQTRATHKKPRLPRCDFAKKTGFRRPGLRKQHGRFVTICDASVTFLCLVTFGDVLVAFLARFLKKVS